MSRRIYVIAALALAFVSCGSDYCKDNAVETLQPKVMSIADWAMTQEPQTIVETAINSNVGGVNDYYSEDDSWFAVKNGSKVEYVQISDSSNHIAFRTHYHYLVRLNRIMGALGSAYLITQDDKYVEAAMKHAKAWFCDPVTRMTPSLRYAASVPTVREGSHIGVIEANQFIDVVRALQVMEGLKMADINVINGAKSWFGDYAAWLVGGTYSNALKNEQKELDVAYVLQIVAFGAFSGNSVIYNHGIDLYKERLIWEYLDANGTILVNNAQSKMYILDMMAAICRIAATQGDDLWSRDSSEGKIMHSVMDAQVDSYSSEFAHTSILMGAVEYAKKDLFKVWNSSLLDPRDAQNIKYMAVRSPMLWL